MKFNMGKKQKKYSEEYKKQIVELYSISRYTLSNLESEYGAAKSTIFGWIKNLSPINISQEEKITMKEYKALQKKMRELEIENEILKKATAIFAKRQ